MRLGGRSLVHTAELAYGSSCDLTLVLILALTSPHPSPHPNQVNAFMLILVCFNSVCIVL